MARLTLVAQGLPLMAVLVHAANYPTKPADLTTPVQQRLAVNGVNGEIRGP